MRIYIYIYIVGEIVLVRSEQLDVTSNGTSRF